MLAKCLVGTLAPPSPATQRRNSQSIVKSKCLSWCLLTAGAIISVCNASLSPLQGNGLALWLCPCPSPCPCWLSKVSVVSVTNCSSMMCNVVVLCVMLLYDVPRTGCACLLTRLQLIAFSFRPGTRTGSLATISTDSVNRGGKFCTLTLKTCLHRKGRFSDLCPWSTLKEFLFLYFIHVRQSGYKAVEQFLY